MTKTAVISAAIAATVALTGCAATGGNGNTSSVVYKEGQALTKAPVAYGRVLNVQSAQIESSNGIVKVVGGTAGAMAGGALGSTMGGGTGKQLMTAAGAMLGAVGGVIGATQLARTEGFVITVGMDLGGEMQIVQAADTTFDKGERVAIQKMGSAYRVLKADQGDAK